MRRLWRDQRGNFTVLFGLTAVSLVVIVGMGIDYLDGLSFKSRWDTAADAAALAAIQSGEAYLNANAQIQSGSALSGGAIAAAQSAGLRAFNANAGLSESTGTVSPVVTVKVSGTKLLATVTYAGAVAAHFGPLVGIKSLSVGGAASATSSVTTYINYYVILDVSQSMGIGATQADMVNLFARTHAYGNESDGDTGCVFGCHVPGFNNNGERANLFERIHRP